MLKKILIGRILLKDINQELFIVIYGKMEGVL